MSEAPAGDDGGRLAACRACGNRVARGARRCPACGAREPTSAVAPVESPPDAGTGPSPLGRLPGPRGRDAPRGGGERGGVHAQAGGATAGPRPRAGTAGRAGAGARALDAGPPTVLEPSRSRGRADWLFFFKAGDQLVRMADDAPLGLVIRTVPKHTFADGTTGPAYLLQVPDGGGQRFVDADELERGGRLQ